MAFGRCGRDRSHGALMDCRVRNVVPADLSQWSVLWRGYNAFYGRNSLPAEITQTTWDRFFDPHEPVHALVAERAGQLLGLAHYLFHRSTIAIENVCYMPDLFALESVRGQGVGRMLIEAVYKEASNAGSHRVYWQTQESNAVARKLYDNIAERSGFIVYRKQL
jgi:GNAT superfamily N-acetyltransferase